MLTAELLAESVSFLWPVIVDVGVPIAAAGVAALVVVRQIRQQDRHRSEDRRAEAVMALTDLLTREASVAWDSELWGNHIAWQFRANESLIRAYAMLRADDAAVAQWIAKQRNAIRLELKLAQEAGEFSGETIGPHRAEVGRVAAEAMDKLLDWQRGEIKTSWFSRRLPA